MLKEELKKVFDAAKEYMLDAYVTVTVPDSNEYEYIIIKNKNLDLKYSYYEKAYNDNLELNNNTDIKIVQADVINFNLYQSDCEIPDIAG